MTSARARRAVAVASAVLLGIGVVPVPASAAPRPEPGRRVHFDARTLQPGAPGAHRPAAVTRLHEGLGPQGLVDIDPVTGTARRVARLDGFLTAASAKPAKEIVAGYLAANPGVFGDTAALRFRKDYVDVDGTHHLSYEQVVGNVPVFGNGVKADVTRNGELIQVTGSPAASLPASLGRAKLSAAQARDAAAQDVGGPADGPAEPVAFVTPGGATPAWQILSTKTGYLHVVDAATGRVLYRQDLLVHDNDPSALVWRNYPGAPLGGAQQRRSLAGWIAPDATTLSGESAHVFLDVNDDDVADAGEEVAPNRPGDWRFPFKDFTGQVGPPCAADKQCSWDPKVAYSWKDNAKQNAAQLFYYVSSFHDHLEKSPIGFTRAAGNYETADGDPIEVDAIDGADTANGFPDEEHADNATMLPTPDGVPGRMQMFLFRAPSWPEDPFLAANSGDEADVVYHEYTHGMSNRLVVDASGNSTLTGIQGLSMGEAWSDWYAFDHLVAQGLQTDTAAPGEVLVGRYVGDGQNLIRTQPLDCAVGAGATVCPGAEGAGPGGYTYGDFGRIRGYPEEHADGEIWGETLWDLRTAVGSKIAESLVTRAMELSPANPSFLDMRNSIVMADRVTRGGRDAGKIWKVFAARGMGWFAADLGGDDATPVEDFSMPPAGDASRTSVTGTVTDAFTGAPLSGVTVTFAGHASGFGGSYRAVTDARGAYTITGVRPGGTYPKVSATLPGYEPAFRDLRVERGVNRVDWGLRWNWAATSAGGEVTGFNGEDFSDFGCGPGNAVDGRPGSGWLSDAVYGEDGRIDPRYLVVRLPVTVDVAAVAVNPTGDCGDASASTGDYRVETSADGQAWTVAAEGHFGVADRNRMNEVPLAAGSTSRVRFLRYTMLGTQIAEEGITCPDDHTGCYYVNTAEIGVYGASIP
ncbi:M36 family metallopeptidase [Actinoplanes sp. NPDC051470]|uniref:M36 family metallopeptidase n=1 Tax=Actinoplanes sp. NPDC051470 TaxID=3157224 RepID=UPI003439F2AB